MATANSTQSVPQLDDATRARVKTILDINYTAMHDSFTALAIVLDPCTVARLDVDPDDLRQMLARQGLSSIRAMMEIFGDLPDLLGLSKPPPAVWFEDSEDESASDAPSTAH